MAGGILSPPRTNWSSGQWSEGVTLNGEADPPYRSEEPEGAVILASRSEWKRGEWDRFEGLRSR